MKNKSIISLFAIVFLLISQFTYTSAASSEEMKLNVQVLDPVDYEESSQHFTTVDLSEYATRDFTDDVEGDGKGGWSDQGDNDMRMFSYRGNVQFENIPFLIIDPASNDRKAVVAVRGQNDKNLPTRVDVEINKKAAGVYFLHSSPYGYGNCGKYEFVYEDGSKSYITLKAGVHINDFWDANSSDNYRIVFTGENAKTSTASLGMFALNNPHPEKTIKSIGIQTSGNGPYIMLVAMTLTDKGPYLPSRIDEKLNPNRRHWIAYSKPDEEKIKGTLLDFSYSLDAPAGKHGAVIAKNDGFAFADGTDVKFWGTNIVGKACCPDDKQAQLISDTLARCGINLVRMSKLDEALCGEDYGEISSEQANKLCGFIDELKKRGIYTYLAPIGDERFFIKGFYDDELIALQKKFITNLLSYENPTTRTPLGKDVSIAFLEFASENSMYNISTTWNNNGNTSEQINIINKKYSSFIKEKYGNDSNRMKTYGKGYGSHSNESILNETMALNIGWESEVIYKSIAIDFRSFMTYIQQDYYNTMAKTVLECGSHILTTGNSNSFGKLYTGDSYGNTISDFVARNVMWDMPLHKNIEMNELDITGKRDSILRNSKAGYFYDLAGSRFFGTPYVISEYGTAQINPYQSEPIMMMAAIAGQQGWTPIQYAYAIDSIPSDSKIVDYYSMCCDPSRIATTSACSQLFRCMAQPSEMKNKVSSDDIFGSNDANSFSVERRLKYRSGLSDKAGKKYSADIFTKNVFSNDGIYFDAKNNFFAARSENSSAVTLSKKATVKLSDFTFTSDNDQATVVLTAENGVNTKKAKRFLLTAVGRSMNSHMALDVLKQISDVGCTPVYVEPISGKFTINQSGNFKVYSLDFNGQRMKEIKTSRTASSSSFKMLMDNQCIYYEIVRE